MSLVQLLVIEQLDVVLAQSAFEALSVMLLLLLQQGNQVLTDGQQLFQRCLSVLTFRGDPGFHLGLQ